jgi:putative two-component system response regulator
VCPTLEGGDVALQRFAGRVLPPCVLVPFILPERFLNVGRGEVDRRHDRTGERIGPLSGVNGAGAKPGVEIVGKDFGHVPVGMSEDVKLTCLIVDDEPQLRHVLTRLMESDGFVCLQGASGLEALEILQHHDVTLMLTDLRMPKMDGITLLKEVKAGHPDTAVVMITAVADVDVAVSCLAIGAMDYLMKPFNIEEVRARVRQALEKRRLVLDNRAYQQQLEQRVRAQAHRLEELFLGTMQAFAAALEVKDPYTRGHSIRVSQYSVAIARQMRLDTETIRQVEIGGHLHDIGKIGVRESVLNKPGPLTDEEYEHIMTHPVVGWRILSPLLTEVPLALHIVRSHHERFDGRGIPDGLEAGEIPMEARIAAVADAFDAMTSGRAYRRGGRMTLTAAVEEVERCCGTQFDPEVVAAFSATVADGSIGLYEADNGSPVPVHKSA